MGLIMYSLFLKFKLIFKRGRNRKTALGIDWIQLERVCNMLIWNVKVNGVKDYEKGVITFNIAYSGNADQLSAVMLLDECVKTSQKDQNCLKKHQKYLTNLAQKVL